MTTRACFLLLVFFLATILTRFLTRQILVEKLGWDNAFTKIVFWGDACMGDTSDTLDGEGGTSIAIDWASRYPFSDDGAAFQGTFALPALRKYTAAVDLVEEKINRYTNSLLLGHTQLTKTGRKYNDLIGCRAMPIDPDEHVILLDNGYMTYSAPAVGDEDLAVLADNVSGFSDYLNEQGIYFVYANAGSKVCPSDKQLPPGAVENTNENADRLIGMLEDRDVDVLDYRPLQEAAFDNWYDSYYVADHHWKNSTGFWAAGILAGYLNAHAGLDFDLRYFDKDMYSFETTEDHFLGGQGRDQTTAAASLEPFDKILPRFKTDFSIQIPTRGVDIRGAYPETLFREKFYDKIADYSMEDHETKMDAYNSVMWRNDALGMIQDHLTEDNEGKRLLMIQDSFGWYLSTFLAADIPRIDLLNPTAFNGSLRTYIEKTKPNAVVLLLCERNIRAMEPGDYAGHNHYFDLR